MLVNLDNGEDKFVRRLTTYIFSVKFMYTDFINGHTFYSKNYLELIEMIVRDVSFVNMTESINHLLFECSFARLAWRITHFTFNIALPKNYVNMFGN
jgi:hypothetical protein